MIFSESFYFTVVGVMIVLAVIVFFALQRITAGYGMMYDKRWGPVIGNRIGWVLMEAPVFFLCCFCGFTATDAENRRS